ncbi:MAG: efflux RND transporter periplasmic adaptor subunit [Thermoguttaceae bacterium]
MWRLLIVLAWLASPFLLSGCKRPQQGPPQMPTPEVAVVTVEPQSVLLTTELPGRTSGYLVAEIRPQVNGLLRRRLFTEGSDVKKGDVLYEIDPAPYEAAYASAVAGRDSAQKAAERARAGMDASIAGLQRHEAVLKLANTSLQRNQKLIKTDAVSAMEIDKAVADVEVAQAGLAVAQAQVESDRQAAKAAVSAIQEAEAAVKTAQINLDYTKITAPISGRIGRSEVTEGAIVMAYQPTPLATIQQFDPVYVDVPQSTVALNRLRRSMSNGTLKKNGTNKVKILLQDGTAYQQEGSLQFRDVTVDPTTGSVILRIVVPNPDRILLPGMFVRAIIDEGIKEQAILVPQQAVSRDPKGNPTTLVVGPDGKVQQRGLSTDRALGDQWLVSSGLSQGDRVIVEGMQKVRPGATVKVVPFEAEPTGGSTPAETAHAALY